MRPSKESARKAAERRYGGAIQTERSGMVELYPRAYRQQLIDAFIAGYESAVTESFKLALAPQKETP